MLESRDRHCVKWALCEINQDISKAKRLHKRICTRKMSAEMSTASLAIGADMCCVERLE